MSQTDSLEDEKTLAHEALIQTLALRLSLPAPDLARAIELLERSTPLSGTIGLLLLERLNLECGWKALPQARLLQLCLQNADQVAHPELGRLLTALKQNYPEYFIDDKHA